MFYHIINSIIVINQKIINTLNIYANSYSIEPYKTFVWKSMLLLSFYDSMHIQQCYKMQIQTNDKINDSAKVKMVPLNKLQSYILLKVYMSHS